MEYILPHERISLRKILSDLPADQAQNLEAILTSEKAIDTAKTLLIIIGAIGVAGMALTAPNSLKLLAPFMQKSHGGPLRSNEQRRKLAQSYYYLKRSGQIKFKREGNNILAFLTEKGHKRFHKITTEIHTIPKPAVWNGSWWLVAADVPTKEYRIGADMFRLKLRELHFYPLQRTLWIHPFDPRSELEHIGNQYNIGRFITVMEIKRLDRQDEKVAKAFFKNKHIL